MTPTLVQSKTVTGTTNGSGIISATFDSSGTSGNFVTILGFSPGGSSFSSIIFTAGGNVGGFTVGHNSASNFTNATNGSLCFGFTPTALTATGTTTASIQFLTGNKPAQIIMQEWSGITAGYSLGSSTAGTYNVLASDYTGDSSQMDTGFHPTAQGNHLCFSCTVNSGAQASTELSADFSTPVEVTDGTVTYTLGISEAFTGTAANLDSQLSIPSPAQWKAVMMDLEIFPTTSVVQNTSNTSVTTTVAKAFTSSTVVGNLVYASVYSNGSTPVLSGSGGAWTLISDNNFDGTQHLTTYYRNASGTKPTITATDSSATVMELHLFEVSGVAISPVVFDNTPLVYATPSAVTTTGTQLLPRSQFDGVAFLSAASEGGDITTNTGYVTVNPPSGNIITTTYMRTVVVGLNQNLCFTMGLNITARALCTSANFMGLNVVMFDSNAFIADSTSGQLSATGAGS